MIPDIERQNSDKDFMVDLWDKLERFIYELRKHSRIADGELLENRTLAVGDNYLPHGLGRPTSGMLVVRQDFAASLYEDFQNNPVPDKILKINSSAPCTVSIWVF